MALHMVFLFFTAPSNPGNCAFTFGAPSPSILQIESARGEEVWSCCTPPLTAVVDVPQEPLSTRAIFAARLTQAQEMRGLSQRALGDRMGLGKDKGSSRINRYERQVTAVGFDNLERLAEILEVPPAYLLASTSAMADAILAFSALSTDQQSKLASTLKRVTEDGVSEASLAQWLDQMNPKA